MLGIMQVSGQELWFDKNNNKQVLSERISISSQIIQDSYKVGSIFMRHYTAPRIESMID